MLKFQSVLKRSSLATLAVLLASFMPLTAFVAADSSTQTCTPPSGSAGVHKPVGADASTYTYNCATGLWQNSYYTYDPSTGLTTPTYPVIYTYDPTNGV